MNSSNSGGRARIPRRARRSQLRAAAKRPRAARDRGSRTGPAIGARGSVGGAALGGRRRGRDRARRGTAPTVKRSGRSRHDADRLEARPAGRAPRCESSDAQTTRARARRARRRGVSRAGHASRAIAASPTASASAARSRRRRRRGPADSGSAPPITSPQRLEPVRHAASTQPARRARRSCARPTAASSSAWVVVRIVWPRRAQGLEQPRPALAVELGGDVVEQQQRPLAARLGSVSASASTSASSGAPLLALRAEGADVARLGEDDVVELRPGAGQGALDVAAAAAAQGLAQPVRVDRAVRPIGERRPDAGRPPSASSRAAKAGSSRSTSRVRTSASAAPVRRRPRRPRGRAHPRSATPGADAAQQVVALGEARARSRGSPRRRPASAAPAARSK